MIRKMVGVVLILAVLFGLMVAVPRGAFAKDELCNDTNISDELREMANCDDETVKKPFARIVNILLYIIGVVSIVMVIYSGMQMTLSTGDAGKVAKAKMILIYALAGLAISILAYAIVNFVINKI